MQQIELPITLFNLIGVKYTTQRLSEELRNTPYINTMYGVGILLSKYNIDCNCVRLKNKEDIKTIPLGIIIYKGAFAIVRDVTDNGCLLTFGHGEKEIPLTELYEGWNGVIMIVHKSEFSGEPDYDKHKKEETVRRIKALGFCALCVVGITLGVILNWHRLSAIIVSVIAVNAIGIGISYLLLQKQLHIPNRFADKLCGLAKESHCEDVTQSDGATFLGLFKLSEIGAAFFSVNFLALIFAPQFAAAYAIIAAIVLPFSFWSVWYQKVKAKSWCVLCLMTLALMWIQAGLYLGGGYYVWSESMIPALLFIGVSYGVAVISINQIMALLEKKRQAATQEREFIFLKSQDYVIDAYVAKSTHYDISVENCSSIIFGNENAPRTITAFSNPYCGPCAQMHKQIESYPGENVRVQYIMTFFSEERSKINKYIIAAYQQLGASRTWKLLSYWYDGGKQQGEEFFAPFNLDITTGSVAEEFEKHRKWSGNDNLYGTPTVMVNGVAIEYPYEVNDYRLFPYETEIQ